jgi:hypothetical protein
MSFAHLPCQQQVTQHGHHINHSDFGDSVSLINFKKRKQKHWVFETFEQMSKS